MTNNQKTIINRDIIVEYPQGAGGAFLSTVLACCTEDLSWINRSVNFHKTASQIAGNHWYAPANNIISIDDPGARYNFWLYYFRKRIVYELEHYRYQNKRWVKCPYENLDSRGDGFWLLNQCKFIISYQTQQPWKINWSQMITDPARVWNTVENFLEENHQPNHWKLEQWLTAVDSYKQTLSKKITINPHQVRWQIWATALLQEQGITPDFDLIDNFRSPEFLKWLNKHSQTLLNTTKEYTWCLG